MKIKIILLLLPLIICLIWYGEKREIYRLENTYITVWKTYGNKCYIIPRKYYGLFKPEDNYIQTTVTESADVIWKNKGELLIACQAKIKIVNNKKQELKIQNYYSNKSYNDSVYLYFDGNYHRYKSNVKYLNIFIKEGYATYRNGTRL